MPSPDLYRLRPWARHSWALAAGLGLLGCAPSAAFAQCNTPTSTQDLQGHLSDAEAALSGLNTEGFMANVDLAEDRLPCLDAAIPARLAANFHRVYGIRAFGRRDPLAPRTFAAARWIEPDYQFSKSLLPEGNPIRKEYEQIDYAERATEPLSRPETGAIYVDGVPAEDRPISWPAVIQWVDGEQTVQWTDYVLPGEKLPEYPLWSEEDLKRPPPVGLIVASAGAAVLGGTLYGVALAQEARYKDTVKDPVPDAKLNDLRRSTNTLVIASAVSATASVGMGVAVVVGW